MLGPLVVPFVGAGLEQEPTDVSTTVVVYVRVTV